LEAHALASLNQAILQIQYALSGAQPGFEFFGSNGFVK
jgi:hypothetical protein